MAVQIGTIQSLTAYGSKGHVAVGVKVPTGPTEWDATTVAFVLSGSEAAGLRLGDTLRVAIEAVCPCDSETGAATGAR